MLRLLASRMRTIDASKIIYITLHKQHRCLCSTLCNFSFTYFLSILESDPSNITKHITNLPLKHRFAYTHMVTNTTGHGEHRFLPILKKTSLQIGQYSF
jgi:hypothetical protein